MSSLSPLAPPGLGALATGVKRGLAVTQFTQSLGAELLTNGDFSQWTGDNPTGWTVTGESGSDPMVTQVAPDGSAGTGAARFYSSAANQPRATQNVIVVGDVYETDINISAYTSGSIQVADGLSGFGAIYTTALRRFQLGRAASIQMLIRGVATPVDVVIDSISVKRITLNAQQTVNVNATHTFTFILPPSPVAGQEIHMCYRIPATDPFLNSWDAYLRRNAGNTAWDFRLDSISAGTRTNRINVTSVGTPHAVRVVTSGDTHTCYTGVSETYTQRGSMVTNTTHNTATGINTIYSSAVTPTRLESA